MVSVVVVALGAVLDATVMVVVVVVLVVVAVVVVVVVTAPRAAYTTQ